MKTFSVAHDAARMPLLGYVTSVGGVLLAFMLLSNAYMDRPRDLFQHGESDLSIKIKSTIPLRDRVVFDTSIPTIVPEQKLQLEPVALNDFVTKA